VERKAHSIQAAHRHKGEWFNLTVTEAMAAVITAARAVNVQIQLVFDRQEHEAAMRREREADRARWAEMNASELLDELSKRYGVRGVMDEEARDPELYQLYQVRRVQEQQAAEARLRARWKGLTASQLEAEKGSARLPSDQYRIYKEMLAEKKREEREQLARQESRTMKQNHLLLWIIVSLVLTVGFLTNVIEHARQGRLADGVAGWGSLLWLGIGVAATSYLVRKLYKLKP
jgi:hypothetical protein